MMIEKLDRASFIRRALTGLFLFALCASAIIALALESSRESLDQRPTERSVASRSLPGNAADVVAVDETVASAEPSAETVELAVDETPSNEEAETLVSEALMDIQSDEQEEVAFSDDVSEETAVVETAPDKNANSTSEVAQCASEASVELRPVKISEIRIGDRVPGVNPEGRDGSDEARRSKTSATWSRARLQHRGLW